MPRPKRTRAVASTRSAAPVAQKEPSPAPLPAAQLPSSSSTDIYDVSDREKQGRRSTRSSAAARTSAVAPSNPRQTAALNASRKNRDSAMHRLENITSTATGTTSSTEDEVEEVDLNLEISADIEVEVGRRADATPARAVAGGRRTADFSGLDLDDSMFDDLNTTINTAGPASAQRSLDMSMLTASHYKRRPRGNSFLSRNNGPIRPSSRAGPTTPGFHSTLDINNFKRRPREPSILGTAQKERPQRPEPESDSGEKPDDEDDLESDDDLEDLEMPELEATPPRRRSSRRSAAVAQAQESSPEVSSSVNPRKRKSTELHEHRPRSSPYADNPLAAEESEDETASQPGSLPPMDVRPSTPLMDEEEVAPPLSSSSEEEAEIWPPLKSLAKGRTRRAPSAQRRTPPSPPPPQPTVKTRKAAKAEAKLTTADLAALLPRRRHRSHRADPFAVEDTEEEIDAAGLGIDDDELHLAVRSSRRRPAQPLARAANKKQNGAAAAAAAATSKPTAASQRKGKQPAAAPTTTNKRQTRRRTYGKNSDKENEEGEDQDQEENENANENEDPFREEQTTTENSDELLARVGPELKNASRKFKEVDKWELAYEEMTQSSSPGGGR
ncbi:ATP-dependent RNA helicase [Apiospora sp. TS-2023a]